MHPSALVMLLSQSHAVPGEAFVNKKSISQRCSAVQESEKYRCLLKRPFQQCWQKFMGTKITSATLSITRECSDFNVAFSVCCLCFVLLFACFLVVKIPSSWLHLALALWRGSLTTRPFRNLDVQWLPLTWFQKLEQLSTNFLKPEAKAAEKMTRKSDGCKSNYIYRRIYISNAPFQVL